MNHPTEEILVDFILDELDERESKRVREHVGECDECRARVQKLMATLSALNEIKEVEPSGAVRRNVLERLELDEIPKLSLVTSDELKIKAGRRRPLLSALAIAAAIIFALYLGQIYFPRTFAPKAKMLNARLEVPSVVSPNTSVPVNFAAWNEAAEIPEESPQKDMKIDIVLQADDVIRGWSTGMSTDSSGLISEEIPLTDVDPGSYEVVVQSGGRNLLSVPIEIKKALDIELMLNRPVYRPNESIKARVSVRESGGPAAANRAITFVLRDPLDGLVKQQESKLDEYGVASFNYYLADIVPLGEYTLKATIDKNEIERKIIVDDYELPAFRISLESDREYVTLFNGFKGKVKSEYFIGKPIQRGLVKVEYFMVKSDSLVRLFSANGHTDNMGEFPVVIESSVLKNKAGEIDGVVESYFRISVEDSANQSEEMIKSLPLTGSDLVIKAFPEGGRIRPLVKNVIYVSVSDPFGKPVECNIQIDIEGNKTSSKTSPLGTYSFAYEPEEASARLKVIADLDGKLSLMKEFTLETDKSTFSFIIRSVKSVYKTGEEIELEIILPFSGDLDIRLDAYKGSHWIAGMDVADRGTTQVKIPVQGAYGDLTIEASLKKGHIVYGRDKTKVVVLPPDDLTVNIKTDKATYEAGEAVKSSIEISSKDKPKQASLGVVVADKSLIEAGEKAEAESKLLSDTILAGLEGKYRELTQFQKERNLNEYTKAVVSELQAENPDWTPKNTLSYIMTPELVEKHRSELFSLTNRWKILTAFMLAILLYVCVIAATAIAIFNLRRGTLSQIPVSFIGIITFKVFAVWASLATIFFALTIAYPNYILFIVGVLFVLGFFVSLAQCLKRVDILLDNGVLYHLLASSGILIFSLLLAHLWMVYPQLGALKSVNPMMNTMFVAVLASIGSLMILAILFIPARKGEIQE